VQQVASKKLKVLYILLAIAIAVSLATTAFFLSIPIVTIHPSSQAPSGSISPQQALKTAMPYITQYAKENNRIVTSIDVTFSINLRDWEQTRGNASTFYPAWTVEAIFLQRLDFWSLNVKYSSDRYGVFIWADNGQYAGGEDLSLVATL
jgi:hypothetical protein